MAEEIKSKEEKDEKNEKLREELLNKKKNGYDRVTPEETAEIFEYAEGYKEFLDKAKTEREAVCAAIAMAEAAGFKEYVRGGTLAPGDKIYAVNRKKAFLCAVIGKRPLEDGLLIAVSHIDAPRIDLKQAPLYEDEELAFFKTHYYGGIRKYQWVTIPLELRGVIVKKDGTAVDVVVGEDAGDPVLTITDLLPHLSKDQDKKTLTEAFTGEGLNPLAGGMPYADKGSDRVKLAVMCILNEKYGITEADLLSAELCLVPAGKSRDVGLDRSFIGAYGQDDRSCAYASFKAMLDMRATPDKTAVCILADKEEIGSEGVSGMQSAWFDTFAEDICGDAAGGGKCRVRVCLENSLCLSADVGNAFDPNFPEVSDKRNNAFCNGGALLTKFTGARGKSGSSDAAAELIAELRQDFDGGGVIWQMGELGKVDQGGGGTIAMFMANRNIATIDAGVPVLSMHAPFEVTAKLDCFMLYKAMRVFFGKK